MAEPITGIPNDYLNSSSLISFVITCMKRYPENLVLQSVSCGYLRQVVALSGMVFIISRLIIAELFRKCVVQAFGIPAIAHAMKIHIKDAELQERACYTLSSLSVDGAEQQPDSVL